MQDGDTALHIAARRDYGHIISILLMNNADRNIVNNVSACMCMYIIICFSGALNKNNSYQEENIGACLYITMYTEQNTGYYYTGIYIHLAFV